MPDLHEVRLLLLNVLEALSHLVEQFTCELKSFRLLEALTDGDDIIRRLQGVQLCLDVSRLWFFGLQLLKLLADLVIEITEALTWPLIWMLHALFTLALLEFSDSFLQCFQIPVPQHFLQL